MTYEDPRLQDHNDLNTANQALNGAISLSNKIAETIASETLANKVENNKQATEEIIQFHLEGYSKPAYDKLRKMFRIKINDSYITAGKARTTVIEHSDFDQLRENIVTNAINAGATKLDVTHETFEQYSVLVFQDDGQGMTQEFLDKIELSLHGDGVVNGLGTRNIFNIARENGLSVKYHSEVGVGTRIRILIPHS